MARSPLVLAELAEFADEDSPGSWAEVVPTTAPAGKSFNAFTREARDVVEQRERTLEQLTELNRQKSVFVSTTNHELRTPLTSISGYVEMLQDGDFGSVGPEQARVLEVVRRNTERLRLLIEDLLLINKLDQDQENRSARHRVMDLAECGGHPGDQGIEIGGGGRGDRPRGHRRFVARVRGPGPSGAGRHQRGG